jgi:hypothetical protein
VTREPRLTVVALPDGPPPSPGLHGDEVEVVAVAAAGASGRNLALAAARAPAVLYAAPGCRLDGATVAAHLRGWEDADADLGAVVSPAGLSVRRDLLESLGGFDESPSLAPGGDEVDLCLRMRRRRRRVVELDGPAASGVPTGLAGAWRQGRVAHRLAARHPWLPRAHPPGPATAGLGLLAACVLVAVRWRLPAALALPPLTLVAALAPVPGRPSWSRLLAAAGDLGYLFEGLRRRDLRALWTRPVPPAAALSGAVGDWVALAAALSLALAGLAWLSR